MNRSFQSTPKIHVWLWFIGIIVMLSVIIIPVYLLVKYSLSDPSSIATGGEPIPLWPYNPTFGNYLYLLKDANFFKVVVNSVTIALSSVLVTMLLGVPAAYVLGRYRVPGRKLILIGIISVRLFPDIASAIPIVEFFVRFGLHQTYTGIILTHTLLALPYVIFITMSAFETIPIDLEQQAWLLGAGRFETFVRILVPLTYPGIASSAIYTFLLSWDEFIFAYFLVMGKKELFTLSLYLNGLKYAEPQNLLAAISVFLSIPVIIFSLVVQKYMVAGFSSGSVK